MDCQKPPCEGRIPGLFLWFFLFVGGLIAELRELEDKLQERRQLKFRDKGKAIKFRKQRDELPAHMLHLMEVESKGKSSPRQFQSLWTSSTSGTQTEL